MSKRRNIFIGDIQGCWDGLERLLDKLRFDPAGDRLCLAGDLVNRGGKSLKVLRQVSKLGKPHFTVLGNHDLHLLAYWHMHPDVRSHNPEFERVLAHSDGPGILEWLRQQPLLWMDETESIALVHAGIDPRWTRAQARACAAEVEETLRGERFGKFIDNMYGNRPDHWQPDHKRYARFRTVTNVLTRMRFVRPNGKLDFESSGDMKRPPKGFRPWFELLNQDWRDWTVIFGHWSMLGYHEHRTSSGHLQAICLDSGCVWGGRLTTLVVKGERRIVQIECGK